MKEDLGQILKFQLARDWKQFHSPKNLAISLSLEAAEALEIFQWSNDNSLPKNKKSQLGQELADIYYYLLLLAHETGIDIRDEFRKKMEVNASKYPVDESKGSSRKYNEL